MGGHARRTLAILAAAAALAATASIGASAPSAAALLVDAITNVTVSPATTDINGLVTTQVDWQVPDGTQAGDTFTLTLPAVFTGLPTDFQLLDPDGNVVADGTINDDVVTFTMTAYAENHTNVSGTATFIAHLDQHQVTYGQTVPLDYGTNDGQQFDLSTVVNPLAISDATVPHKTGAFVGPDDTREIKWNIYTPIGPSGSTVVNDVVDAAVQLDCGTPATPFTVTIGTDTGVANGFLPGTASNPTGAYTPTATIVCNAATNTFTVTTGPTATNEMFLVSFYTSIVTQNPNIANTFHNTASVTTDNGTQNASWSLTQSSAAGNGDGDTPVPVLTITKGDANGNAADTSATAATLPTGGVGLRYTVTNNGQESLKTVAVSDSVVSNGTVTGLSCDFSALGGPATGTTWAGPLAVGASFPCTATLAGVAPGTPLHEDIGTVTAVGVDSDNPVTASNPYWATAPAPYSLGDEVWNDANGNGIQDAGEAGIAGVTVTLLDSAGHVVGSPVVTDAAGRYHFDQLVAGDYTVRFTAPSGTSFTTATAGSDQTVDSNADATGASAVIHLGPSDTNLTATTAADGVTAPQIDRTIDAGLVTNPISPSIRVEKYDGAHSFTPNPGVSTADKNTDAPQGDADTAATAIAGSASGAVPVAVTLNNNGNVPLYDVTVIDQTTGGTGTVTGLSCAFPDGTAGLYFAGPLVVGAVVQCTGTLPALGAGATHQDTVAVHAHPIGPGADGTVSDTDLFNVVTPAAAATTTTTTTDPVVAAATAAATPAPSASHGPLAFTGADIAWLLALAGALGLVGLTLWGLAGYRRRLRVTTSGLRGGKAP